MNAALSLCLSSVSGPGICNCNERELLVNNRKLSVTASIKMWNQTTLRTLCKRQPVSIWGSILGKGPRQDSGKSMYLNSERKEKWLLWSIDLLRLIEHGGPCKAEEIYLFNESDSIFPQVY